MIACSSAVMKAQAYLAKVPPAVSGNHGHDRTFSVACVLTKGCALSKAVAMPLLQQWNQKCQPQWTVAELEHKLDDAMKKTGKVGYLLGNGDSSKTAPGSFQCQFMDS